MTDRTTRRDLMRPVQLLAIAFACAIFAGGVAAVSGGLFVGDIMWSALPLAGIVAGITFVMVLLGLSLLLLAVDPAEVEKPVDRPVLFDEPAADDKA